MNCQLKSFLRLCLVPFLIANGFAQSRRTDSNRAAVIETSSQGEIVIYFNSFESPQDTVGWRGNGFTEFRGDAAPDGGSQSLHVSGGCIWPHALYKLPANDNEGSFLLRCWGKDLGIGGGVSIDVDNGLGGAVQIYVHDKEWTFYQSSDTLRCPAGKNIELQMGAGGIAASAMLVDRVEIVRVDGVTSMIEDREGIRPHSFRLFQNFPNPFNSSTIIPFTIPPGLSNSHVELWVHNVLGQRVKQLLNQPMPGGKYAARWDGTVESGSVAASGVYFYNVRVGDHVLTGKMSYVK